MKQHKAQQAAQQAQSQLPLKRVELQEVIAQAYYIHMRLRKEGKTTRRITVSLPPHRIPGFQSGEFSTGLGVVKVKVAFSQEKARWYITVVFPDSEGFKLGEFVSNTLPPPPTSQPKWREHVPTPEEIKEVQRILGILEE